MNDETTNVTDTFKTAYENLKKALAAAQEAIANSSELLALAMGATECMTSTAHDLDQAMISEITDEAVLSLQTGAETFAAGVAESIAKSHHALVQVANGIRSAVEAVRLAQAMST